MSSGPGIFKRYLEKKHTVWNYANNFTYGLQILGKKKTPHFQLKFPNEILVLHVYHTVLVISLSSLTYYFTPTWITPLLKWSLFILSLKLNEPQ